MSLLWNGVRNKGMSCSETFAPFIFKYITLYLICILNLISIFLNRLTLARILITSNWVIAVINFGRWTNELLQFRILSIGNSIMISFNTMRKTLSYLNHCRRNSQPSTMWNWLQGENMSTPADSGLLLCYSLWCVVLSLCIQYIFFCHFTFQLSSA